MKKIILSAIFFLTGILIPDLAKSQELAHATDKHNDIPALVSEANRLYEQQKPDLKLAATLIERVASTRKVEFYTSAQEFYTWTLLNVGFAGNEKIIEAELNRTLPLVADSVKKRWKELFKQQDPSLLKEWVGFWKVSDPYASTKINERLLEHWVRIAYAKKHFTKADNSPYGTDDRGTFYVRLGPPDKMQVRTISITEVNDPRWGGSFEFFPSSDRISKFELWEYHLENGKKPFFIFAERDGQGQFGLRSSAFELINMNGVLMSDEDSYNPNPSNPNTSSIVTNPMKFVPPSIRRNYVKGLAQYALLSELSLYHNYYNDMFREVTSRMASQGSEIDSYSESFLRYVAREKDRVAHMDATNTGQQLRDAPDKRTELVSDQNEFTVNRRVYRFLSEAGVTEYLVVLQPAPGLSAENQYEYYQYNKLFVYDENWNQLHSMEDAGAFSETRGASMFILTERAKRHRLFYSSELINTSFETSYSKTKFTQLGSRIQYASGKKSMQLPQSLPAGQQLMISDVVLSGKMNENQDARVPVVPALDPRFAAGSELTLYFEAYNVPEGGYSFEYHFEKDRKLFVRKRNYRQAVTVRNEKARGRDTQLFIIGLNELPEGTYDLVINFSPLNDALQIPIRQKRIQLEIIR